MQEPRRELNHILSLMRGHNHYMANRLDLIASNSWTSYFSQMAMGSILPNSYCIGLPGARFYGGCTYIDMIERELYALVKRVFGNPKHVVVQFLSGMQANIGAYNAFLKPGDKVMAAAIKHGGHYSHQTEGPLRFFSACVTPLPFDDATYNVDLNKLEDAVKKEKPTLLVLGWSEFLFPHPLQKIKDICTRYHVKLMYDMSHVAGLIAGGVFQPEALFYADMVTSSTGKTLHAPDHGLAIFNDDALRAPVLDAVRPLLTSNTHPQEVAALGVVLSEMLHFGKAYAKQVVANAKALGSALDKAGVHVLYGDLDYTESHTILVEYREAAQAVTLLDRAGVLINPSSLPWDKDNATTGLRLGTQVLTRRGLTEKDMPHIAQIIKNVLLDKEEPEMVHYKLVAPLAKQYTQTAFSFDDAFSSAPDWIEKSVKSYESHSVASFLRGSPAFAQCELAEIESIENYFTCIKVKKAHILFKAGDAPDAVYFVISGAIHIMNEENGHFVLSQTEYTHFGELGVILNTPRKYKAQAAKASILVKINAHDFRMLLKRFDSISTYFNRYITALPQRPIIDK